MVTVQQHPSRRGVYRLTTELKLPVRRDEVFEFFSDAHQLERITPPWLHFSVQTPHPIEMRAGTLIDYKLRLHGVPIRWQTEIKDWDPPYKFVDEQVAGPYRLWRHLHTFEELDGATICRDEVDYAVPGGKLVHWLIVKRDVKKIFEFRRETLTDIFCNKSSFDRTERHADTQPV